MNCAGKRVDVAICIATCRRPRSLGRLLRSLEAMTFTDADPAITVVVVDNDPDGTARLLVERLGEDFRWPLLYEAEPQRNIAHARNKAIAAAERLHADSLAFVDDDERVAPEWLDRLLAARRSSRAPIVAGPIIFTFGPETPEWVRRGDFFKIERHSTGTRVQMAFTGNVLIGREYFLGARFDPKFGISGGGDSQYFAKALRDGATIVWADDAIVEEPVPRSRANAAWILRRAYRVGNRTVSLERDLLPRRRWLVPRLAKAFGRLFEGVVTLPFALVGGRAATVAAMRKIAHGLGCLSGIGGFSIREYERIHGS